MESSEKKVEVAAEDKTVTYEEAETKKESEAKDEKKSDKASESAQEKKTDANADNKSDNDIKSADEENEDLAEVDIIDINKEEKSGSSEKPGDEKPEKSGSKKGPKTTGDFIAKQKKRKRKKRIITFVILAAVAAGAFFYIKSKLDERKAMLAAMSQQNVQTAVVEKKTLYDSKDATGTLYALESRTLTANLGSNVATIDAVNVKVGDTVIEGDVLVAFSTENIEKDIANKKEDISDQKQLDAISAADAQRDYVNSYTDAANELDKAAKNVERALNALHEACNGYGQAKRELTRLIEDEGRSDDDPKVISQKTVVSNALATQEARQKDYDDAVEAQAQAIEKVQSSSLSKADSTYQQQQITAGDKAKQYERELEKYEDSLDEYIVTASLSGVVTEVNVSEGNKFSSGTVLTIQDNSGYKAEVLVSEYDIPKVKKAYEEAKAAGKELEVVVKTEATGDKEYKGHVTLIAPTSTTTTAVTVSTSSNANGATSTASSSSTANYKVSIEIDDPTSELMIGMSAKVAIVVDKSPENALCVPYNCVEEKEDGTFVVRVMDEKGDMSASDSTNGGAKGGTDKPSQPANGIIVENNTTQGNDKGNAKDGSNANVPGGPKYREVVVDKIFETDYYAAIIPKNPSELSEGDEVMIISEKADGNDMMMMFGGAGGGGGGPMGP